MLESSGYILRLKSILLLSVGRLMMSGGYDGCCVHERVRGEEVDEVCVSVSLCV